ncbi:MAG: SCO family protein [Candidatus Neomarinimicrobiota bacterium]|nr:MAG: SCO family protein [Candidatus Neomarinimicrobiota bacterium]
MSNHSVFQRIGVLLGIWGIWCCSPSRQAPSLGTIHPIPLVTAEGRSLPDSYFHRVTVVEFFFTSCQGACPIMANRLEEVDRHLVPEDPVQFLCVTVDPDRDTLTTLREYRDRHHYTSPRWTLARGERDSVRTWIERDFHLGVGTLPAEHPTRLILLDPDRNIRGYFDGLDADSVEPLVQAIRQLLQENGHAA